MTEEQLALLESMRRELGTLSSYIKTKNQATRSKRVALEEYDGKGKVFEGFLMLRLRASLDAVGSRTAIIDGEGNVVPGLVVRGAPGKLRRSSSKNEPTYIRVAFGDLPLEIHNSLIWPDQLVEGQGHEIDIAVAHERICDNLAMWHTDPSTFRPYSGFQSMPGPLMAIEAKFRSVTPDRELGRSLTGLAVLVQMRLLYLISLMPATEPIREQMQALSRLQPPAQVYEAAAYNITLENAIINTAFLDHVAASIRRLG